MLAVLVPRVQGAPLARASFALQRALPSELLCKRLCSSQQPTPGVPQPTHSPKLTASSPGETVMDEDNNCLLAYSSEVLLGDPDAPVLLVCERASSRLPPPWEWTDEDANVSHSQLTFDVGAAGLTRLLNRHTAWPAVLSRFCHVLCDPNSPQDNVSMPSHVSGINFPINYDLGEEERQRRIDTLFKPFHGYLDAIGSQLTAPKCILSVRSFLPTYTHNPNTPSIIDDSEELPDVVLHFSDLPNSQLACVAAADAIRQWGYRVHVHSPLDGLRGDVAMRAVRHMASGEGMEQTPQGEEVVDLVVEGEGGVAAVPTRHMNVVERVGTALGCAGVVVEVRSDILMQPESLNALEETIRGAFCDAFRL